MMTPNQEQAMTCQDYADKDIVISEQREEIAALRDWQPEGNILDIINRAERAEAALAEAQRDAERYRELLREAGLELARCKVFVGSREKMHPDGLALYQDLLDQIDATIQEQK